MTTFASTLSRIHARRTAPARPLPDVPDFADNPAPLSNFGAQIALRCADSFVHARHDGALDVVQTIGIHLGALAAVMSALTSPVSETARLRAPFAPGYTQEGGVARSIAQGLGHAAVILDELDPPEPDSAAAIRLKTLLCRAARDVDRLVHVGGVVIVPATFALPVFSRAWRLALHSTTANGGL
jgi:hypothetical protein